MTFVYVCLGGAFGTGARFLLATAAQRQFGTYLAYGTLTVNVLGSFLIGILMSIGNTSEVLSPTFRTVLSVGFLGGFTTYSAFNHETLSHFQDGEILKGMLNSLIMLVLCFLAGTAGIFAVKLL